MSVVTLGDSASKLEHSAVRCLASNAGLELEENHIDDFATLLGALHGCIDYILEEEDYVPKPDLEKYPRDDIHRPADTDKGGWANKCTARCVSPTSDLLKGKTVALKDNIALAGVKCTNGTEAMDWTPNIDATIATRIMDAGATITGKAACENACLENASDTSCTGKVHNPHADNYSCGGSSSGSGRLVGSGAVDMAIGCDQGGSIRIPSANCGLVGLKPTWGLVPYTGIISLDATIDHAGPMAKTVPDATKLLQAIAGRDGIDDRQPPFLPEGTLEYVNKLNTFLEKDSSTPLAGLRVGVLEEGFSIPGMNSNVANACRSAIDKLKSLGAVVVSVSIPLHTRAAIVWMCSVPIAGVRQSLFADMTGRKQLHLVDRVTASGNPLPQAAFDKLGPAGQNVYPRYLYIMDKYGTIVHAKSSNLLKKINDAYERALASEADVLVMPTLPQPACKLFSEPSEHNPLERLSRNIGLVGNTAPFNSTGHPALSIPVGSVPAMDDENVKLPTGLQIVGRKFEDVECLKVGAAWERAYDRHKL